MDKNSGGSVFHRAEELGPHPAGNLEPFTDFKQKNSMTTFLFLNNKNKQYVQWNKKSYGGERVALINVSNAYEHFLS